MVNLGFLSGGMNFGALWHTLVIISKIVLYFLILGAVFLVTRWFFSYKVDVIIFEKRGEGSFIKRDKGRLVRSKDGSVKFKLLKDRKVSIEPPNYSYLYPSTRGRSALILEKIGDFTFLPVKAQHLSNPGLVLSAISGAERNWLVQDQKEIRRRHEKTSVWATWGMPVMVISALIIIMLIMFVLFKQAGNWANAMNSAGDKMADAVKEFGRQIVESKGA